jgi:hypothetical protein
MGKQTRALYARRSPVFAMARAAYEPLTAPLIVAQERLIAATFRAIDRVNWSLDHYDEEAAERIFAISDFDDEN